MFLVFHVVWQWRPKDFLGIRDPGRVPMVLPEGTDVEGLPWALYFLLLLLQVQDGVIFQLLFGVILVLLLLEALPGLLDLLIRVCLILGGGEEAFASDSA